MMTNKTLLLLMFSVSLASWQCTGPAQKDAQTDTKATEKASDPRLNDIRLPEGFSIGIFAEVENARSLALGEKGTVFVGNKEKNNVYALVDEDRDGRAEKKYVVAKDMDTPNGVAFHNGSLYIAEVSKIWRIDNIEDNLEKPGKPVLVYDKLPTDQHHGWKYIAFGPDGKLYVPVGAPCNICNDSERDKRYAAISRMNPDGTGFEVYANGVRNTVGFTWHPQTGNLWFTDNGRDNMGDNIPPDELNVASKAGMHFGYPYIHAGTIPDPEFGKGHSPGQYTAPAKTLTPHGGTLGIEFYTASMFPSEYKNQAFIAEHGSWNRTEPIGYRVMVARINENKVTSFEPFAQGWLKNGKAWGRPVDVLQMPDGSLLVSDDFAGLVYRIAYKTS
ncbi:MAG TPA: PQQ-dependent sugar dehydrogenase [Sphingobacteriaceae bacterium]